MCDYDYDDYDVIDEIYGDNGEMTIGESILFLIILGGFMFALFYLWGVA